LLPTNPKEVKTFPVLGATPGLFATLQVMETLKLIVGFGEPLAGRMLFFDGDGMNSTIINVERRPECTVCSNL
jgi:adenylyltransferase/sulfurtransferase